jgi:hypothetical protein
VPHHYDADAAAADVDVDADGAGAAAGDWWLKMMVRVIVAGVV